MTSLVGVGVSSDFFHPNESLKKVLPFYLFSEKIAQTVCFHFTTTNVAITGIEFIRELALNSDTTLDHLFASLSRSFIVYDATIFFCGANFGCKTT